MPITFLILLLNNIDKYFYVIHLLRTERVVHEVTALKYRNCSVSHNILCTLDSYDVSM